MGYVVMLAMVTGAVGALINYLMTGERPKEMKDYFFPRTGEKDEGGRPLRVALPTYVKDIYHYYEEPGRTALNKAHPALNTLGEIWSNRDFYGTEVWNPGDPPTEKVKDILGHLAAQFEPFSVRGLREEQKRQSGAPAWFPFVGLTPAPKALYKTDAERMLDEMMAARRPVGTRTKEEARRAETRREIVRDMKRGIDAQPKVLGR